jgi:hypothetical protein
LPGADDLRENLKVAFARPTAPGEVPGRPPSELDRTISEEMHKIEIAESQRTFEDHVSRLKEQWQWFTEHETKFTKLRDKRLAHRDVSISGDKYEPTEIEPFEWRLAVEALGRLIGIVKHLSAILGNESKDFDQLAGFAQQTAEDFRRVS